MKSLALSRLADILEHPPRITRGKLCVSAVRKSGKKAYNLQYRRLTKQFVKAVPDDQVEEYRRSTEAYRMICDLFQRFIDEATRDAIREIAKEANDARRKSKAKTR